MGRRIFGRAKQRRPGTKYRRWAFLFTPGEARYLQRKKRCLRRVLDLEAQHLLAEDVHDTRVDVVWPKAVQQEFAVRIAWLARYRDHNFALRGKPLGVKDDGKEQKGSREKTLKTQKKRKKKATKGKDGTERHDKKDRKGKKDKKKSTHTLDNYFMRRSEKREPSPSSLLIVSNSASAPSSATD